MIKSYIEAKLKKETIYRADTQFDLALEALSSAGIKSLIPMRRLANARMQVDKTHSLNSDGSYTQEGFVYAKNAEPVIARISPLVVDRDLARQAVEANSAGNYFSTENRNLYDKIRAEAEADKDKAPSKMRAIILPSRKAFQISPTQNGKQFKFLIGDKNYLIHAERESLTVYPVDSSTVDLQDGTLLVQAWLRSLPSDSDVDGNSRNLDCDDRVRGVFVAGEASAPKISEEPEVKVYTPAQVEKFKSILQGVRTGEIKASELEKLLPIVEALPTKR